MSGSKAEGEDTNVELTPEALAVMRRARRSFMFSIGLLILGFGAVALALVYRSGANKESAAVETPYQAGVISMPQNAQALSVVPSEGMFALTYQLEGKARLRLIDGTTGAVISDIAIVNE